MSQLRNSTLCNLKENTNIIEEFYGSNFDNVMQEIVTISKYYGTLKSFVEEFSDVEYDKMLFLEYIEDLEI